MKIRLDKNQRDIFQKTCIEQRFTVQFHDDEMNDHVYIAYVRDDKLGELSPALGFWLGVAFTSNLYKELEQPQKSQPAQETLTTEEYLKLFYQW
jgi:hypothetical protein